MDRWRELAVQLDAQHLSEPVESGTLDVVIGDSDGNSFTVLETPEGVIVIRIDYPEGQNPVPLETAVLSDQELSESVRAAYGSPITSEMVSFHDDHGLIFWQPHQGRPDFASLAPTVHRLSHLLTELTPGPRGFCQRCAERPALSSRRAENTVRACAKCLDELEQLSQRWKELFTDQAPSHEDDNRAPFALPEHLSVQSLDLKSRQLHHEFTQNPRNYKRKLLALVLLGQVALLASTGGVATGMGVATVLTVIAVIKIPALAIWLGKLATVGGGKAIALILGLAVAAGKGLWGTVTALFGATRPDEIPGLRLSREQAPRLYEWFDQLAQAVEAPAPDQIILYATCNCSASERRDGRRGFQRIIAIGLPMLETLEREEFRAVMAHELAHLKHGDSRGRWIYRTVQTWMELSHRAAETPSLSLLRRFADWYVPNFFLRAKVVGRQAEYEADRRAATVVSPEVCAQALIKTGLLAELIEDATNEAIRKRALAGNLSRPDLVELTREGFSSLSETKLLRTLTLQLEEEPCWLDTHPLLRERLEILGVPAPPTFELNLKPQESATSLFDHYTDYRNELLEKKEAAIELKLASLAQTQRAAQNLLSQDSVDHVSDFVRRARYLSSLDQDEEALTSLDEALRIDPGHPTAGQERIGLLLYLDRVDEAADGWISLLEADPEDFEKNLQAAEVFRIAGRLEQASRCLQRALEHPLTPRVKEALEIRLARLEARSLSSGG